MNEKVRVLYITQESSLKPGASRSLFNLIDSFISSDLIDPIVLVPKRGELGEELETLGVKVLYHNTYPTSIFVNDKSINKHIKYLIKRVYNVISVLGLSRKIRQSNIDIVHINKVTADIGCSVAEIVKVPYVWHIREFMEEDHGRRFYNRRRSLKMLSKADRVIAISKSIKKKYSINIKKNIDVVYNGIDTKKFKTSIKFKNEKVKLILAGRITDGKGQIIALKAINHLVKNIQEDLHLTLVGDIGSESYHREIEDYIVNNNLSNNVTLLPFSSDLNLLRSEADIGLLCSNKEAFGRVTIETLASGLLFIGSNSGATPEIITHRESGLLYHPNSHISLAEQIEYAINNVDKSHEIIRNGLQKVEQEYDIEVTSDKIYKIYVDVLNTIC